MAEVDVISTQRLTGSYGWCPHCDVRAVTLFNLTYVRAHLDRQLQDILAHLGHPAQLKHGVLRRCSECGQGWYVDEEGIFAIRVPRDREALLAQWSERRLDIDGHSDALASIGSIEADRYGNSRGYHHIPCEIEWADGSTSDPCILLVTTRPPIMETQLHVRLFENVARVRPTDFALPLEVRCATRRADEQRMGYAPTWVEDGAGHTFILNWSADVFAHEGIRGKDIRLTSRRWTARELPPILGEPRDRVTYVYADPTPDAARLAAHCPG